MALTLESLEKQLFGRETTRELEDRQAELRRSIAIALIEIEAELPIWENARDAWNNLSRGATTNLEYSLAQMSFHKEVRQFLALCTKRDRYQEQLKQVEQKLERRRKKH